MKSIDQRHATALVSALAVLALFINYEWPQRRSVFGSSPVPFYSAPREFPAQSLPPPQVQAAAPAVPSLTPQQKAEIEYAARARQTAADEAQARRAAQLAAEEHARFLARYLSTPFERKPGKTMLGIVVASDTGDANAECANALAARFNSGNTETLPDLFSSAFVSDRLFTETLGGSTAVLNKLELARKLDALMLARQTVQYSSDPSLENVITATMNLEIEVLPVAGRGQTQKQLLTASGAGFKNEAARDMAMERLLKDIAKNPKLSRIVLAPPQ